MNFGVIFGTKPGPSRAQAAPKPRPNWAKPGPSRAQAGPSRAQAKPSQAKVRMMRNSKGKFEVIFDPTEFICY